MLSPLPSTAAPARKAVLLVLPYQSNLPRGILVQQAMQAELGNAPDLTIDWYYEYLNLNRFQGEDYEQQLAELYATQYRHTSIDLVFVLGELTLNFWLQHRDEILPDAPVVFLGIDNPHYLTKKYQPPENVTGIVSLVDHSQLLTWIPKMLPKVKEIVLVQGVSQADQGANVSPDDLRDDLDERIRLTDWSHLPLAEIKQRAATLPPNTVIFYQFMFQDAAGVKYRPIDVLPELTSVSSVPVITRYDHFIGLGTIGGYVYSLEQVAAEAARMGERILRGTAASDLPITEYQSQHFVFDHLALQRYHIPLSALPESSIIKNRQPTLWEQYRLQLMGLAALVGLVFTANILRIRAIETRNRELDQQVDAKTAQVLTQQRKIAVMEERERIRRELHDSVGQVLSYLNVQTQAVQTLLTDGKLEASRHLLTRLVDVTQKAHMDTRQFMLTMKRPQALLSLSEHDFWSMLRAYIQEFETQSGVHVLFNPPDLEGPLLPPAKTLDLLRIIQEALANVRKHAAASQVQIIFSQVGDYLQVVIADDGCGFELNIGADKEMRKRESEPEDREHTPDVPSFGIDIMRKRAVELGGQLDIRSQTGQGTQVLVQFSLVESDKERPNQTRLSALRVLLVDDHPLVLEGLRNLLSAYGLEIVGLAHDGLEALDQARKLNPDVIVMDIQMPRCDGIEATRRIKAEMPEIDIMMLTVSADETLLFEALKAGASGYLLKSMQAEEFFSLLTGLDKGAPPIAPQLAGKVLHELQARLATEKMREATGLSAQQQKILDLVAQGWSYRDIAKHLFLSERTVRRRMKEIIEHLQVSSRAEALKYASEK